MLEQFLARQKSPNTAAAYRRDLAKLVEFLGGDRLTTLEPSDLLAFQVYLTEEGLDAKSANRALSATRSFLKFGVISGVVTPAAYAAALAVPRLDESDHLPKVLTDEEVERLLFVIDPATLAGARLTAFVQLGLSTGARLSEMVGLDIEELDWQRRRVMVTGKGDKQRFVRFGQAAAEALVAYLSLRGAPSEGPLFTNDESERITPRYFQAEMRRCYEKAGVKEATVHSLRHTFATRFLDDRGDIHALAALLGHEDIRTTLVYTRTATKRIDRIYDEFDQSRVEATSLTLRERVVAG